ncbi:MAG: hypothetical protein NC924_09895 [Candidatus Omnitrophica bacterium]|nr:hypothetical protein [Candidatus Omnitrophota bacterium]
MTKKIYPITFRIVPAIILLCFLMGDFAAAAGKKISQERYEFRENTLSPRLTSGADFLLHAFQRENTAPLPAISLTEENIQTAVADFLKQHRALMQQAIESTDAISEGIMSSD